MDPHKIPKKDLPLIVFSDHTSGLIQTIIKIRTKGFYNHVMWMHKDGVFASQGNKYSRIKVSKYMKKGNRLKFISINGLSNHLKKILIHSVEVKLKQPWYTTLYDWVGIVGQAIGLRRMNIPGLEYCSEDVPYHLRALLPYDLPKKLRKFIKNLPTHGSPEDLNQYMKDNKEHNILYGRWDSDTEI